MVINETFQLAKKLWDYHHMNHALEKADCILVLGSHDLRVAERTAQLYFERWAPMIIFSGGLGNFTREVWTETEADQFAAIAISIGVPKEAILIENKSTNTGENILFSHNNCWHKKILPRDILSLYKNLTWKEGAMQHLKNTGQIKN